MFYDYTTCVEGTYQIVHNNAFDLKGSNAQNVQMVNRTSCFNTCFSCRQ